MEVKELTEWVFEIWHEWENVYGFSGEISLVEGKKMDEVIERLERGEKCEKIWEELIKFLDEIQTEKGEIVWTEINVAEVLKEMKEIKQKYFPKPSDNFTKKVMDKINKKGGGK